MTAVLDAPAQAPPDEPADGGPLARAPGADAADRRLGWMAALGGVLLALGTARVVADQWGDYPPWWSVPAVALVAAPVVATAAGPWLPMRVLRALWHGYPLLLLAVLATWTVARVDPSVGATTGPWVWQLETAAASFAAIAWPFRVAVAYSQVTPATVLLAALAADGHVSRYLLVSTVAHLANVLFVAVFAAIRRQLGQVWDAEARLAARVARLSQARALEAEHARLAAIVHDEVLATLNLAAQAEGPLSDSLVGQARAARAVVVRDDRDQPARLLPGTALVAAVRARVAALCPEVTVGVRGAVPPVPGEAADAVLAALDEAVRNSLRHAAGGAVGLAVARRVAVDADGAGLRVTVRDDGVGFDPAALDPRRLGVRRSIVERMAAVPGGSARVESAPCAGTTVTLGWDRP